MQNADLLRVGLKQRIAIESATQMFDEGGIDLDDVEMILDRLQICLREVEAAR